MIIVSESEVEAWTLEPPIEFMITRVKVVKLYPLGKKLPFNIIRKRNGVIPSLVLQLIYIVVSYVLVGGPRDCIMVLHETEESGIVEARLGELCQVPAEVLQPEHVHGIQSVGIGGDR